MRAGGEEITTAAAPDRPWPSPGRAWYAVGILVVAFIFSFVDRIIIALLVEPIKRDLGVSDFGIGMLQGIAFTIFYATVGIPIGRLADRYSRRKIIGIGIFLWSLATAACGLARNFWDLFLARVGVGVGEAALSPAAYSMISDFFPRDKLGRALGVYQSGGLIGAGLSFLVGGLVIRYVMGDEALSLPIIGTVHPWQMVFFAVGLPGVIVALLMTTVLEPARRGGLAGHGQSIPLREVVRYVVARRRVFLTLFCGFSLLALPITTTVTWIPAYYTRVLGYSLPDAALSLGKLLIVLSPAGVVFGGWLVDWFQRRGYPDAPYRVGIGAAVLLLPLGYVATTTSDPVLSLWLFAPFVFAASISIAVAPAALQLVAPNQMRAQLSAVWMLFLNIVTALLGPTGVGIISDFVFVDEMQLGSAIALVNCASVPVAAVLLWFGRRAFSDAAAGE